MQFELQETAAPVPSTFKWKHARSPAPTAENSNKLRRISAGQGMYKMAKSMDKVAEMHNDLADYAGMGRRPGGLRLTSL